MSESIFAKESFLEVACRNARRLELKDFIKELGHLCLIAGAEDLTDTNFFCAITSYKKSLENRLKDLKSVKDLVK